MFDLLGYLLKQGKATQTKLFSDLDETAHGLPNIDLEKPCTGNQCKICQDICPTSAIAVSGDQDNAEVLLNLGACIGCNLCISNCPTELFVRNPSTKTAVKSLDQLTLSNIAKPLISDTTISKTSIFKQSLAIRVVSTGCSACDLEIGAASNPIFDMERFGISVVASPRMADALVVTGPVGKGMQEAVKRTYEAMAAPKLVVACGTCAITGGVHKNGYANANGLNAILPVDVYIPGCPPHPWSIIYGLLLASGKI